MLKAKRTTQVDRLGLIRVKAKIEDSVIATKEVERGTSAIEVLKNVEGVKRAIFAKVKYPKGI